MKKINILFVAAFLCIGSLLAQPVLTLPDASQGASVSQTIGITNITIEYHSPGVKGRPVWGLSTKRSSLESGSG
jgi:hypothetical protein